METDYQKEIPKKLKLDEGLKRYYNYLRNTEMPEEQALTETSRIQRGLEHSRNLEIISSRPGSTPDEKCFITTACIRAVGLPDDCSYLQILRNFRDTQLNSTPEGRELISQYYQRAPEILSRIESLPNSRRIWTSVFNDIQTATKLVKRASYEEAVNHYKQMVERLEKLTKQKTS